MACRSPSGSPWEAEVLDRRSIAAVLVLFCAEAGFAAGPPELSPDQTRFLESVRASALEYTQRLPDFICTQITRRDVSKLNGLSPGATGVSGRGVGLRPSMEGRSLANAANLIEERLTFFNRTENYEVVAVDGKKVSGLEHLQFEGAISAGEFGSALRDVFDPASHAVFMWEKAANLRGRRVDVFRFHVPKSSGTIVVHRDTHQQIVAAYGGNVFVDPDTLEVVRIVSRLELPTGFPIRASETTIDYTPEEIGGRKYNLPVHSEVRMQDDTFQFVNTIDFRNYHRFAAESTIHYANESPQ